MQSNPKPVQKLDAEVLDVLEIHEPDEPSPFERLWRKLSIKGFGLKVEYEQDKTIRRRSPEHNERS